MKLQLFDIDNWREITATLSRNRTRTLLTAFGIFWGTTMLALLYGGANGLQDLLKRQFKGVSTNTALVFTTNTSIPYKGYKKGREWNLNETDINTIRHSIPQIKRIAATNQLVATAINNDRSYSASLLGISDDFYRITGPGLVEGRHFNDSDIRHNRKVAIIGKRVAAELFGNESPIGKQVNINNIYYTVVGTYTQVNQMRINREFDENVCIPITTMHRNYNIGNAVDMFIFEPNDGYSPSQLKPTIQRIIYKNHSIHPNDVAALRFFDVSERFETIDSLFKAVDILALLVGIGSLLAGIIGVGNIMWIIVKERTQEIGIRRAIGARPSDMIAQILSESMTLTVIAGLAGILFATIILAAAQTITTDGNDVPGFQLTFASAMTILVAFIILGTAAGTIPAVKAMRIRPIQALNDK